MDQPTSPTPLTDAALFDHDGNPVPSLEVIPALAAVSAKLERDRAALVAALEAAKNCRGIDDTDQESGETFRDLIDATLSQVRA